MNQILNVSLRQKAIFIPETEIIFNNTATTSSTAVLLAHLMKFGFCVSEKLLKSINNTSASYQEQILTAFSDVTGVNKNWTPLVKGWDIPTGENIADHIQTLFANIFPYEGTILQCGHKIPPNTFPLERYNGCPFCGTPFEFGEIENFNQGSTQRILELWTTDDVNKFLLDLLESKTPLDASQIDSLKILLSIYQIPDVKIPMKETVMVVINIFVNQDQPHRALSLFSSPTDILRYLWYKHTGFLQIIKPLTIVKRSTKNNKHYSQMLYRADSIYWTSRTLLKLKYSRKECRMVASWLTNLPLETHKFCEAMHPNREMWIRFIRALRLAEYSKRPEFKKLNEILDIFYSQKYEVLAGRVQYYRNVKNPIALLLLQQRPGIFARSLFSNMLWFGLDTTIKSFIKIIDKVPARLLFTLNMYSEIYFNPQTERIVSPLGGVRMRIKANKNLSNYAPQEIASMKQSIADLCFLAVRERFSAQKNLNKSIYIDPVLFKIPLSIGERSETIQDLPNELIGSRFPVQGDYIRLFMQWGNGLPAQHLDMDLNCSISYPDRREECSYACLSINGCNHSGDIQEIPNQIGTAEYINLSIPALRKAGAKYATFTCNAYSTGNISPNMVVGWMDSKYPMKISKSTGVAYDPSCVQHQVRITNSLSKGLVFGVLDISKNEIIWLEMPFQGQVVKDMSTNNVEALLKKLDSKLNIGSLLLIKAEAQNLTISNTTDADEVYTKQWSINTAAVTQLLIG